MNFLKPESNVKLINYLLKFNPNLFRLTLNEFLKKINILHLILLKMY